MRNKIIIAFIAVIFMASCKKEQESIPDEFTWQGSGSANRNNETLQFKAGTLISPDYANKFSLLLEHYSVDEFKRGQLSFRHIPYMEGKYLPQKDIQYSSDPAIDSLFTVSYYTNLGDGCLLGDKFVLVDTITNFFSIDSLNTATKEAFGRFNLTMRKDTSAFGELDPSVPQILTFTSGSYSVTVNR